MGYRKGQNSNRAQKLLLAGAGVTALAKPIAMCAQTPGAGEPAKASPLPFEVASVKPHAFAPRQFAFGIEFLVRDVAHPYRRTSGSFLRFHR